MSAVFVSSLDMVQVKDEGGFRCGKKKCLTQGCPCSGAFPLENSRADGILLLLVAVFMPGQTLLVKGYDYLWALMIGLLGKDEISLIRIFPERDNCKLYALYQITMMFTRHIYKCRCESFTSVKYIRCF